MSKLLSKCPACNSSLKISVLKCDNCGLELKGDFDSFEFGSINEENYNFLITFLKCRGNLKEVQNELKISYPLARKKLSNLLKALKIEDEEYVSEEINMENWKSDISSFKASEVIKHKLFSRSGVAKVTSVSDKVYEIRALPDGVSFFCEELPVTPPYRFEVFDVITDFLIMQGGKAKKGTGRNARFGEPGCDENTVVGIIGKNYFAKKYGESVYDPVFVLAAVLEWAGIAYNRRGYIELTPEYKEKIYVK